MDNLRHIRRTAVVLGLLAALAGCNTVGGLGQDLQTGGAAITDEAQEAERGL